ncbi:hypothetical protein H112_07438 [Trichophyton rubrum D6]|uniref:Uncharacterized protein n=2 Tax=Trichophyton rubrum TaxID=5551 RepID=F2SDF5_TRIRC|nr:uncharacterized protein TERG_00042 [Trichophyton rubrum CBS 118892]EZF11417.1 hypothetical protein H100_07464 [Trichophyton rubrum MR850]EZF38261.1 hypothetical protein H102_07427 [Trichophyton rubrum CBS 100081]EZF48999.1 hypothetical protein H103_07451 [Trichophyton rubrum CBS 288.86]EZF59634.1 hypothetical protein H104_07399 [Trichophyton rubrum CBS 289.86]EZF80900.1 hypothetical protein H110_07446 [Trichophyton rubrum MR1448]EZF91567.1 hypothetical protein H113_07506 [Trichophyton rubr
MPSRLSTPVLTVDPAKIHQVDTRNAESLHGMWMVFSRCADFMEEGRRLENLSWRLWNRETFCVAPQAKSRTNSDNNNKDSLQQSQEQQQQKRTHSGSRLERLRRESKSIPDLSSSVESALSDEGLEQSRSRSTAQTSSGSSPQCPCTPRTIELDPKPAIVGEDSVLSISRGRERHITSLGLEKMVYSIKEKKQLEPICVPKSKSQLQIENRELDATPRASSPTPVSIQQPQQPQQEQEQQQRQRQHQEQTHLQQLPAPANNQSLDSCSTALERVRESDVPTPSSDTSVSSTELPRPSSSVVRGFSPSKISSSFRSHSQLSPAASTSKNSVPKQSALKQQKPSVFTLGCSSGDEESSFEDRMAIKTHRSSLSDGLNHLASAQHSRSRTSFIRDTAATSHPIRPIRETSASDEDAIASSDEDDESEISESAIEDEGEGDSSDGDWEDSVTESGRSSVDDKQLFQRVDSRPNLVSRRSLLTMMMHQPQQNFAPTFRGGPGANSRSTPAMQQQRGLAPADGEEEDNDEDHSGFDSGSVGSPGLEMKRSEVPHSRPIVMTSIPPGGIVARAHSPRTTRRNMLATELTESLRRHLLWERQQKTTAATATAAFKRRHTACDVAGLQEYPGANDSKGQGKEDKESKNSSWNHYFDYGPWEYHVKGW